MPPYGRYAKKTLLEWPNSTTMCLYRIGNSIYGRRNVVEFGSKPPYLPKTPNQLFLDPSSVTVLNLSQIKLLIEIL